MIAFDLFCLMRIAKIKCTFKLIRDPEFTERFWVATHYLRTSAQYVQFSISPSLNLNLASIQHVMNVHFL